jgi:hypothetical protein
MKETDVTSLFMDYCPGHHVRVETKINGIPDINYCFSDGVSGWIEAKHIDPPGNKTFLIKLRPEQAVFLTRRTKAGGRAWILVGVGLEPKDADYYLIHGKWANDLQRRIVLHQMIGMASARLTRREFISNNCALLQQYLRL